MPSHWVLMPSGVETQTDGQIHTHTDVWTKKLGTRSLRSCTPKKQTNTNTNTNTHKCTQTYTNTYTNTHVLRHTYISHIHCIHLENLPHHVCNILIVDCQVNDRIKIMHVYSPIGLSIKYLLQIEMKIISNVHWLAELLTMQKLQEKKWMLKMIGPLQPCQRPFLIKLIVTNSLTCSKFHLHTLMKRLIDFNIFGGTPHY